ncbi:MAG: DUF4097 domain-containing protein [Oscillospiraceae bacterium]|nr:DUF4097 domain-containing protein [Oscillospiraceae bacterium]
MTKAAKTVLLVALCMFAGGLILTGTCIGIARASGKSFSEIAREHYGESVTYQNTGVQTQTLDSIRSLELDLMAEPVTLKRGGDKIVIEWSQDYDQQYDFYVSSSGEVSLKREGANLILFSGDWVFNREALWDFLDMISIGGFRTDSGGANRPVTVTIPEGISLDRLNISTASGGVTLDGVAADDVSYNGADTRLDIRDCQIGSLDVNSANAGSYIRDSGFERIKISAANGRLELEGGECARVEIDGANAELNIDGTRGLRGIDLSGMNAAAKLALPGTKEDYDISADGLNARIIIDGASYASRSFIGRNADKCEITADGLSAVIDVRFAS